MTASGDGGTRTSTPTSATESAVSQCPTAIVTSPYQCNGQTGWPAPLPTCADVANTSSHCNGGVTTAIDAPANCGSSGDRLYTWQDGTTPRYACVYTPPTATSSSTRPLVLFFPGSHGDATTMYNNTSLRDKAPTYNLKDSSHLGFFLVSVQPRNLYWPGTNPDGTHQDYYYRDLGTSSCNPDVRSNDQLVDAMVAGIPDPSHPGAYIVPPGAVDVNRIYVVGWSNGAFFSQMYAIARHDPSAPTPGGHRIAGAVAYAGSDPYSDILYPESGRTSCATPYPSSTATPIYAIHRSCDSLVPCNPAQMMGDEPVGFDVTSWVTALGTTMSDTHVSNVVINDLSAPVSACDSSCGFLRGANNHLNWPNAREGSMLDFLQAQHL